MSDHLTASFTAACFGDGRSPLAARFHRGVHALDVFSASLENFRVAFVVVASFFLSFFFFHLFSLSLSFILSLL